MKCITSFIFLCFTMLASAGGPLVSMSYGNSLRIPNNRIEIAIDATCALTVETESKGRAKKTRRIQLSPEESAQLKAHLESIDWKELGKEKTKGLDGSSVSISYGGKAACVWSPDYETKKRGLVQFQKLTVKLFGMAGLKPDGMPK